MPVRPTAASYRTDSSSTVFGGSSVAVKSGESTSTVNGGANGCPVAGACGLQGALTRALQDFLRRLDQYQLADLTPNRQRFANLLAESGTSEG